MAQHLLSPIVTTRSPSIQDTAEISQLIRSTGFLEPNTTYAYLLLSHHFSATSAVAECGGEIVGCLLGYRLPEQRDCLFVWQVGTLAAHRRRGIGRRLLREIHSRRALQDLKHLEFTIAPTNAPSLSLFESWAREIGTEMTQVGKFSAALFGASNHEDEEVFRIGLRPEKKL